MGDCLSNYFQVLYGFLGELVQAIVAKALSICFRQVDQVVLAESAALLNITDSWLKHVADCLCSHQRIMCPLLLHLSHPLYLFLLIEQIVLQNVNFALWHCIFSFFVDDWQFHLKKVIILFLLVQILLA